MKQALSIVGLCFGILSAVGCSTARKVLIQPGTGGIVAIPDADSGRGKAESIMREVCKGKNTKVTEERETPIASVIESQSGKSKGKSQSSEGSTRHTVGSGNSVEVLTTKSEWRISFQCE